MAAMITYGRTFNLGNYESIRIELQDEIGDRPAEVALAYTAHQVLSMALVDIQRIRGVRASGAPSLGPETIIDSELKQITQYITNKQNIFNKKES